MSGTTAIVVIVVFIVGVLLGPFLSLKAVASFRARRKSAAPPPPRK